MKDDDIEFILTQNTDYVNREIIQYFDNYLTYSVLKKHILNLDSSTESSYILDYFVFNNDIDAINDFMNIYPERIFTYIKIKNLPSGIIINKNLSLPYFVTSLPKNFTVKGNLYLQRNDVYIPECCKICGEIIYAKMDV